MVTVAMEIATVTAIAMIIITAKTGTVVGAGLRAVVGVMKKII